MSNIRKSFNFRNGVQVDDDNFIVNSIGNVGIGTTIPSETLDVIGNVKISGILTAAISRANSFESNSLSVSSISLTDSIIGSGVSIRSGVITDTGSGIVTYYGDGRFLQGLPTSQWLDVDVGLGFTSIYNVGYVGVSTNDPRYNFQVGGTNDLGNFLNGVGIDDVGNIVATGIATANKFVGIGSDLTQLNASSIDYGTISNDRLPVLLNSKLPSNISVSGIITATSGFVGDITGNVTGNLTGTATTATNLEDAANITTGTISNDRIPNIVESNIYVTSGVSTFNNITANTITASLSGTATTASSLTGSPDITVGDINASSISASGIITATTELNVGSNGSSITALSDAKLGIGTQIPTSELQIRRPVSSSLEIIGETGESKISFGRKSGANDNVGVLRYGNAEGVLDIINYNIGDVSTYLHAGNPGINTGRIKWIYGQTNDELMSLTYDGNLGIKKILSVGGGATVTGDVLIEGDLSVDGSIGGSLVLPSIIVGSNLNTSSGVSTFFGLDVDNGAEINGNIIVSAGSSIGIGTDQPITDIDAINRVLLVGAIGAAGSFTGGGLNGQIPTIGSIVADGELIGDGVAIAATTVTPGYRLTINGGIEIGPEPDAEFPVARIDGEYATINFDDNTTIGIGTTNAGAGIDFRFAGSGLGGGQASFMLPPQVSTTVGLNTAGKEGALVFNTTTKKFQGYTGTAWVDLH